MELKRVALLLSLLPCLALAAPVRLCVVGDSITAGFSPATRGWPSFLAQRKAGLDFGIKNVAHSGDKVAAGALLYGSDVRGRGCTHVAILLGTNDLPDGTSAATIYATWNAIATAAEADGARVIGLAILPRGTGASWSTNLGTRLTAFNALIAARTSTVASLPYTYVDTYTALLEPASNPPALATAAGGATDGLHPNNAGQDIIAATVAGAVTW